MSKSAFERDYERYSTTDYNPSKNGKNAFLAGYLFGYIAGIEKLKINRAEIKAEIKRARGK